MKTINFFPILFILLAFSCQENESLLNEVSEAKETAFLKSVKSQNFNQERIDFFDFPKPIEISASLRFDVQDNLMQYDWGNWFSNNNPMFSIELHPNENKIFIRSQLYRINVLETVDFMGVNYVYYSADRKTVAIYYHSLNTHLYHTDFFDFDVYYTLAKSKFKELEFFENEDY